MLANKDINVTLVDMASELDTKPRATHYASTDVRELSRAGVLDDVRELGFTPSGTCWRKLDGTYLAGLQNAVVQDDPLRPTCLPLNRLGRVIYDHLLKRPTATVLWSHELIAMEQDENAARVTCKTPEGEVTFEADYVVGCDGANSKVRRLLFGDWEFPGKTWAEQIVATNVYLLLYLSNRHRCTIPLRNTSTWTQTSSFIPNTGTWPLAFPMMACGES